MTSTESGYGGIVVAAAVGGLCGGLAAVLATRELPKLLSEGSGEVVIDIVFEIGVALIGAAVTAYILGILLNQQQGNAAKWRAEIRRRIHELGG